MINVKPVLYSNKKLKNGEHPIMMRLTINRRSKYIALSKTSAKSHWDFNNQLPKKSHPLFKELSIFLGKKKFLAEKYLLDNDINDEEVLIENLRRILLNEDTSSKTVFQVFDIFIMRLKAAGQLKNSLIYKDALRELKKFSGGRDLEFADINVIFLNKYEESLMEKGLKPNSVFVFLRTLRALLNKAIEERYCDKSLYPFDKFSLAKYSRISTEKRAISKEDIKRIEDLELSSDLNLARDLFLFSYYSRGINFVDIAHLKWNNLSGGRLKYQRRKTKEHFNMELLKPVVRILDFYRAENLNNEYIFPILNQTHTTKLKIEYRIQKLLKQVNKDLKEIGDKAGVGKILTTYVARHSFATNMKKSGVSISVISESLGHDSEKTTKIYLDSFENSVLDEAAKVLL